MNEQSRLKINSPSPFTPLQTGILQRKCACGTHTVAGDKCDDCKDKQGVPQRKSSTNAEQFKIPPIVHEVLNSSGQPLDKTTRDFFEPRFEHNFSGVPVSSAPQQMSRRSLTIGDATDVYEQEADRIADSLILKGKHENTASSTEKRQGEKFDLSEVRIHTGAKAAASARAIDALAYTVGNNIVFGASQFAPATHSGQHLLAHELAHVAQQSGSAGIRRQSNDTLRKKPAPKKGGKSASKKQKKAAPKKKPTIPKICGRNSRKVSGNSISKVNLDVGANTLTIEWENQTNIPAISAGTHKISPGSGLCCVDCNDEKVSQTSGSLCTPKGGEWEVTSTDKCQLSGHPTAKNPTYFQRGGIAIHSGNTSSPPQSHGCSRTSREISELIHDNAVVKKTKIASSGTWKSDKCYLKEASDVLSNRKDVCDGNQLKSKKSKKKPKRSNSFTTPQGVPAEQKPVTPGVPVAEIFLPESDELAIMERLDSGGAGKSEMVADGPGPKNAPVSHESIGEVSDDDTNLGASLDDTDLEESVEDTDLEEEMA